MQGLAFKSFLLGESGRSRGGKNPNEINEKAALERGKRGVRSNLQMFQGYWLKFNSVGMNGAVHVGAENQIFSIGGKLQIGFYTIVVIVHIHELDTF